jgi:hypothetical protein
LIPLVDSGIECAAFRDEDILKKPQAIVAQGWLNQPITLL